MENGAGRFGKVYKTEREKRMVYANAYLVCDVGFCVCFVPMALHSRMRAKEMLEKGT